MMYCSYRKMSLSKPLLKTRGTPPLSFFISSKCNYIMTKREVIIRWIERNYNSFITSCACILKELFASHQIMRNIAFASVFTVWVFLNFVEANDPWVAQSIEVFCDQQPFEKTVVREGCESGKFVVQACLGNCRSYQKVLSHAPHFESRCSSCQPRVTENKQFTMEGCSPGVDALVTIESAVGCECKQITCG